MNIRNRADGTITTEGWLREQYPNTSFPYAITAEILASYGFDQVFPGEKPELLSPYEYVEPAGTEERDGFWYETYVVLQRSSDERLQIDLEQAASVRSERNKRLADCDWTQLPDAPVDATAWATYRQALRDVTAQAGFPWAVQWPPKPNSF
jgi:hypothetical protein